MNEQYIEMVKSVNNSITSFNHYIKEAFHAPTFDLERLGDANYFVRVIHQDWDAFRWPQQGSDFSGIYLLFGHNSENYEKFGLYIGKSSMSKVGSRLYSHFSKHRNDTHFKMNDNLGSSFVLEYVASLNLNSLEAPFLISALEEYVISSLRNEFHLLNGVGNN